MMSLREVEEDDDEEKEDEEDDEEEEEKEDEEEEEHQKAEPSPRGEEKIMLFPATFLNLIFAYVMRICVKMCDFLSPLAAQLGPKMATKRRSIS